MTKEEEYLIGMLNSYAAEINEAGTGYHASVDKSGATPQLSVR